MLGSGNLESVTKAGCLFFTILANELMCVMMSWTEDMLGWCKDYKRAVLLVSFLMTDKYVYKEQPNFQ